MSLNFCINVITKVQNQYKNKQKEEEKINKTTKIIQHHTHTHTNNNNNNNNNKKTDFMRKIVWLSYTLVSKFDDYQSLR